MTLPLFDEGPAAEPSLAPSTDAARWTVRIVAPVAWLNSNDRGHWRTKNKLIAAWRTAGRDAARQAKLPRLQRVHILAELHFGDRRARDAGNWYPTIKAIVDGLVDHGLLTDDNTKFLTGPDIRTGESLRIERGGPVGEVTLTITELNSTGGQA